MHFFATQRHQSGAARATEFRCFSFYFSSFPSRAEVSYLAHPSVSPMRQISTDRKLAASGSLAGSSAALGRVVLRVNLSAHVTSATFITEKTV